MTLYLHLTDDCNLQCSHCYLNQKIKEHFDLESCLSHLKLFFNKFAGLVRPQDRIILHGGEPLLIPKKQMAILLEELRKYHPGPICLQTNFSLMDDEWLQILNNFPVEIGTSYDFGSRVVSMEKLKKYLPLLKYFHGFVITMSKQIGKKEIDYILVNLLDDLGIRNLNYISLNFEAYKPSTPDDFAENALSPVALTELYEYIYHHPANRLPFLISPIGSAAAGRNSLWPCFSGNCYADRLTLTPSGKIYACNYSAAFPEKYLFDLGQEKLNTDIITEMASSFKQGCYFRRKILDLEVDPYQKTYYAVAR